MSKKDDKPNYLWGSSGDQEVSITMGSTAQATDPFRRREKMDEKKVKKQVADKPEDFLKHPRVKAIKQHKLVNDMAYFLHHPQMGAKGQKMPPKKPKG
jgi:hypothetical protein